MISNSLLAGYLMSQPNSRGSSHLTKAAKSSLKLAQVTQLDDTIMGHSVS